MTQDYPHIKDALQKQALQAPPAAIRGRVMAEIWEKPEPRPLTQWAAGTLLNIAILALLWGLIQPGIILQWAWKNGDVAAFQVYRAVEGSAEFSFLQEIPTRDSTSEYKFVDPLLVPGQRYTYQIVGIDS